MTEKEYYKWCKKFKKELRKKCKVCKKARSGAYGILCEHCINKAQMTVDKMKREVLADDRG